MTSYYMRCAVKGSFEAVFSALSKAFGTIYSKRMGKTGGTATGLVLGEQYFFRVGSDAAIIIVLE